MKNKELLQKIKSVKLCLMAHPNNEKDSEFADRIRDLVEIEENYDDFKILKELIHKFKKEELPDAESPYHYEAEIWAGMKDFIKWLDKK